METPPVAFDVGEKYMGDSHHHHHHHSGRRLRQFFRPDGKKVHIAGSPDEAAQLRNALSTTGREGEFDLVVHGSVEHIEALRDTHAHHEARQRQLREQHGDSLADEFERVIRELDTLSTELHMISEHAVQLDANFSKYGYSAHLRTKDTPSGGSSASPSIYNNDTVSPSFSVSEWATSRKNGRFMRLYQRPIVRQYFHRGLLWRAREAQEVSSYELFIDLFYVGIIAISGDSAAEHATGKNLLHFAITFILGWKFWSDIGALIAWFDQDDVLRRVSVLFVLTCLLGFTTNINAAWGEFGELAATGEGGGLEHAVNTYTPLIAFYLAARLFIAANLFWYAWKIPMVRGSMIANGVMTVLPAALWIASIHVSEPGRQALIWPALALDIFGSILMVVVQRGGKWMGPRISAWAKRKFDFFPGTNIEHRIERTGAFVTLVFGYSVVGLLFQSSVPFGINAFFGKAVLGLVQAFSFNWLYFEIDQFNIHTHAIRRHFISALIWLSMHLPFIMSFVLAASTLNKLVLAHDIPHSTHSLWPSYAARSEAHITSGQRWFYCGGLSISLAGMTLISASHIYKSPPNVRIGKNKRLFLRLISALTILLLPLANDKLNSLELIATTTGIVLFVLLAEVYGNTCLEESFWMDRGKERRECTYSAKCAVTRKELRERLKDGGVLDVEEIARREGGEKGGVGHV